VIGQGRTLSVTQDQLWEILQEVTEALRHADSISTSKTTDICYETMQRARFNRKEHWRRNYTLGDARGEAQAIAMRLRKAWDILDPSLAK
jgi:hypothetical protein